MTDNAPESSLRPQARPEGLTDTANAEAVKCAGNLAKCTDATVVAVLAEEPINNGIEAAAVDAAVKDASRSLKTR